MFEVLFFFSHKSSAVLHVLMPRLRVMKTKASHKPSAVRKTAEPAKKEQRLTFRMLKIVPHKNEQPSSTELFSSSTDLKIVQNQ